MVQQEASTHSVKSVTRTVIMTHSCSSIIKKILSQVIDKNIEVIITESRPGNEGRDLARFLSDLHIETTYITEAQINIFMPEVTKVVLGADTNSAGVMSK